MTDPTKPDFAGPCPRCGGPVPNEEHAGMYPGALSRVDNETYICSQCGQDEAMFQWFGAKDIPADAELLPAARGGGPLPPVNQPIPGEYPSANIPRPPIKVPKGYRMVWADGHWRLYPPN